jgi:hypothetical protein
MKRKRATIAEADALGSQQCLAELLTKAHQAAQLLVSDVLEAYSKASESEALTIVLEGVLEKARAIQTHLYRVARHETK